MMENDTDTPKNELLPILDKLKQYLESDGKTLAEQIRYSTSHLQTWRSRNDEESKRISEAQEALRLKTIEWNQFEYNYRATFLLTYLRYLELPFTTAADLTDLNEKYGSFMSSYQNVISFHSKQSTLQIKLMLEWGGRQGIYNPYSGYYGSSNSLSHEVKYLIKFKPVYRDASFSVESITPCSSFTSPPDLWKAMGSSITVNELFKEKSIIARICIATLLDNPTVLRSFLKEYKTYHPDDSLIDLIVNHALIGLAAANGCIKVMKIFLEMKVSLEQKFTITPDNHHPKNILGSYTGSTLEMTPLALALSAAPALKREQAYAMVELLLKAGANRNNRVVKKWAEPCGHAKDPKTRPRTANISLSDFDQIGILDEAVKKIAQGETLTKDSNKNSASKVKTKKSTDHSEIAQLRSELQLLCKKVETLETELSQLAHESKEKEKKHETQMVELKNEIESLKSTSPKKNYPDNKDKAVIIQKMFRGYHVRKQHPLFSLKEERKKEVFKKFGETMGKLASEKEFDQIDKLNNAMKNEKFHEAMQIIRGIPEQEIQANNGKKYRY